MESNTLRKRWRRSSPNLMNPQTNDVRFQLVKAALNETLNYLTYGWSYFLFTVLIFQQCALTSAYNARQDATPDTKACCRAKGVSEYCLDKMCDTSRPPDEFDVFEVANECTRSLSSIAYCLADNRNHTRCCRANAKGADDLCMNLCDGTAYYFNMSMWEEYKGYVACLTFNIQSIFSCLDRGYEIAPGPPTRLEVLRTTSTAVRLKWSSPNILPHKVIRYSVYYAATLDPARRYPGWTPTFQRVDSEDDSKFYDLDRLAPDTRYRLYVVARGRGDDAVSLPSDTVEFVTDGVASKVEAYKWKIDASTGFPTTLICMINVRGGGERENVDLSWYYGKNAREQDSTPLSSATQGKYQQSIRLLPESGTSSDQGVSSETANGRTYVAALTIGRVTNVDFGFYRCTAKTPFGDSSATVELAQSTALRVPQSPPNVTDCCVKEGVQPKCMASCQNNVEEPTAVSLFQGSSSCGPDFAKILRCSIGSADQQQRERSFCCLRRGVPLSCLFLCDSTRPMFSSQPGLFSCLQYTNEYIQCLVESKQYLPSPPVDLRVKQAAADSVILEWSQETGTPDVMVYYVFYKKLNEQNWRKITSGSTSVVLPDLSRTGHYTALVVSANAAGVSDASRPMNFSTGGRLRDQTVSGTNTQRRRKSRNNVRHNANNHHHQHFHNHHPHGQQQLPQSPVAVDETN